MKTISGELQPDNTTGARKLAVYFNGGKDAPFRANRRTALAAPPLSTRTQRRDIFFGPRDYESYLETLAGFRSETPIKIYGYCLMTNHVHLIVDPGADPANLGRLMWSSYRAHVGRMNCDWLDTDPVSLETSDESRRHQLYREFVAEGENELELKFIRESLQRGHVTASEEFANAVARDNGIELPQRRPGRRPAEKITGAEAPVIVLK